MLLRRDVAELFLYCWSMKQRKRGHVVEVCCEPRANDVSSDQNQPRRAHDYEMEQQAAEYTPIDGRNGTETGLQNMVLLNRDTQANARINDHP